MKTSFNDICHEIAVQNSEKVNIRIAIVDDPKSAGEEIVRLNHSEIESYRYAWDEKENKMLPSYPNLVYSRKEKKYYAILDRKECFEDKVKLIWRFVMKSCRGFSEQFDREIVFAKMILATIDKEEVV